MATRLRSCASESSLVLLERRQSAQEEYQRRLREQRRSFLERTERRESSDLGSSSSGKGEACPKSFGSRVTTAVALVFVAWFLGLHFESFNWASEKTDYDRALETLDGLCPPLTRADNTTAKLRAFNFEDFQGDWHKVAWLREPDRDDMRCRFVTDSDQAKNLQHLEQISPTRDYRNKGYHFLLNRVSKLWVVDTDYKSWAMLYTCSPHFGTTTQQAFIVSRKKTLDIVTMGDVLTKWSEYNIPWKEFKIKEQQHQCA
ncbi:lipocalin/cytosolic fatty-acid binding domain-containing protein [Chloropicon primus]|uniref:Lipocalin/cytosolic fatty-acid binding domain-containing protein n=1 Tax=Chloropicon primus TaxID=1764295 RepID=A0A5B8MSF9_9CHLO|nr:hypothetical protein A3770_11p62060 [Chloropicon primus]UPR02901.1 lipocalin/cytosolic fatty-acid binding domain-containing protein [Chloropicon primus]|mmetsp:Transcript_13774/g.38891  ORF Transcript_13774/g.38891 Transcript_13774/m.38891 type:complete len:258 (+) Transcript_13774:393-1166(+)|eukprot:QDZ23688.1 hypothetical protein A3770_11p62060 [Chloropicon primus]